MMEIKVRLDDPAWRLVGQKTISLDVDEQVKTVADVIAELGRRFAGLEPELRGQNGDLIPYSLFLNDDSVRWAEVEKTSVQDGDHLRVILPIAGGSHALRHHRQ